MESDYLYSFIMKGELTKVALSGSGVINRYSSSETLIQEYLDSLSLELLDDDCVQSARMMACVYTAIAAFENMVRRFIVKILLEQEGEDWWEKCISEKIRKFVESRKKEEEKIRWHSQRGDALINYTEFGDLVSIMQQNFNYFEIHLISIEWARQIVNTLERSRNVIMHSGVLGRKDIERIGTNIRDWLSQVGV